MITLIFTLTVYFISFIAIRSQVKINYISNKSICVFLFCISNFSFFTSSQNSGLLAENVRYRFKSQLYEVKDAKYYDSLIEKHKQLGHTSFNKAKGLIVFIPDEDDRDVVETLFNKVVSAGVAYGCFGWSGLVGSLIESLWDYGVFVNKKRNKMLSLLEDAVYHYDLVKKYSEEKKQAGYCIEKFIYFRNQISPTCPFLQSSYECIIHKVINSAKCLQNMTKRVKGNIDFNFTFISNLNPKMSINIKKVTVKPIPKRIGKIRFLNNFMNI